MTTIFCLSKTHENEHLEFAYFSIKIASKTTSKQRPFFVHRNQVKNSTLK